ncbi:hypothetical protein IPJ91_00460 [bacterium]|nr:MAG: hypothetical protein IPJ91_00460 [bacterium]
MIYKELGDLLWYLNLVLDELEISFEELMEMSIARIDKKYPKSDPEACKDIVGESN